MTLSPAVKASLHRELAKRINALGGNVGDPDAITHDERSQIRLLEGIVERLEAMTKTRELA